MTSAAAIKAMAERAIEGLTLPALVYVSGGYYPDRESAKAQCMEKLRMALTGEGSESWTRDVACALRTNPDAELETARWTIRKRPHAPHTIDENRILWIPYVHGGKRLQACYYFEWDGPDA